MFRRKRRGGERSPIDEAYLDLRAMALDASSVGATSASPSGAVSGVVVDVPAQGGFATVVALADGTTSMYTSVGGGTIGAGEQPTVAGATRALVAAVEAQLSMFQATDDVGLPPPDLVRVHALTAQERHQADVSEDSFWGRAPHELGPVIEAAQALITAMREASPG